MESSFVRKHCRLRVFLEVVVLSGVLNFAMAAEEPDKPWIRHLRAPLADYVRHNGTGEMIKLDIPLEIFSTMT